MAYKSYYAYTKDDTHDAEGIIFYRNEYFNTIQLVDKVDWQIARDLSLTEEDVYIRERHEDGSIKGYHSFHLVEHAYRKFPHLLDKYWTDNKEAIEAAIKEFRDLRAAK